VCGMQCMSRGSGVCAMHSTVVCVECKTKRKSTRKCTAPREKERASKALDLELQVMSPEMGDMTASHVG